MPVSFPQSIVVIRKLSFYAIPMTFTYHHVTLESSKPKKVRTNIFPTSSFRNLTKTKDINKTSPQNTGKLFSSRNKLFPCSYSDSSARLDRFLGENCASYCYRTQVTGSKTLKTTFRYETAYAL